MQLTRFERALGFAYGVDPGVILPTATGSPRAALTTAMRPALERGPCVVSFSGGRDSSAVLALAAAVARDHGLPSPVPVTLRFANAPDADEAGWQERVIDHLRLPDWQKIEITGELDLLGEDARVVLRTHGPVFPPNTYVHEPIMRFAAGGSLLTGFDGDGLFGSWRWQNTAALFGGHRRLQVRDALRVPYWAAPRRLRLSSLQPTLPAWIRPRARPAIAADIAKAWSREPRLWSRRVAHFASSRLFLLPQQSLALRAAAHDVQLAHPLADPGFLSAVAEDGGRAGYGSRAGAMSRLFGDVLPPSTIERQSKAVFGSPLWGPRARQFAREWDGTGLDDDLIEPEAVRAAWLQPAPSFSASTLLHAAWLSAANRS